MYLSTVEYKHMASHTQSIPTARTGLNRIMHKNEAELKAAVKRGLAQLDQGKGTPLDVEEIKREGRKLLAARGK